jgi:hypothetical protein
MTCPIDAKSRMIRDQQRTFAVNMSTRHVRVIKPVFQHNLELILAKRVVGLLETQGHLDHNNNKQR